MVLTNFECWAHGGGAAVGSDDLALDSRHVDMFNPRMVQQRLNTATGASSVSHISSNGYYGFSYVNAAHEPAENNSNDDINNTNINNQSNNNNNNNNNNRCVPNANDVNGVPLIHHNNNHSSMDVGGVDVGVPAATNATFGTQRCKKRFFVSDDDYDKCALLNGYDRGVGAAGLDVFVGAAAKRCRFDEDYAAAQYCNDFFSLPSTQIGTQSCLMDTEDTQQQLQQQQQQPQVDVNMDAANLTNQTINNTSNIHFITQQQQQQQHAEQQQQVINTAQPTPVVAYQQQHNYQAKKCQQAIDYDASYGNNIVNINLSNNINAANQNNNKLYYNNHDIERLGGNNAPAYPTQDCRGRENGGCGIGHRNVAISEGNQKVAHSVIGHTYQLNSEGTPAHIKVTNNKDTSSTSLSSIAALYAKTHGGAFYQFTASNAANQPYVEDI